MRDPERIGPIIEELLSIWEAAPDLRFGQLIAICLLNDLAAEPDEKIRDLFNQEDTITFNKLRAFKADH